MVGCIVLAEEQVLADGAIHELDGAVVAQEHACGDVGNGGLDAGRDAAHALEELVLLVGDAGLFCGGLAEVEEAAQLVAELGEAAQLIKFDGGCSGLAHS